MCLFSQAGFRGHGNELVKVKFDISWFADDANSIFDADFLQPT